MKTLEIVYWLRLALGMAAAFLCVGYGVATNTINPNSTLNAFMNGLSIALVTYLISYYIIRFRFTVHVVEPKKLLTTGIGVYFISWMVFWILSYTIIAGWPPA